MHSPGSNRLRILQNQIQKGLKMATKRKVDRPEYNRWVRWLKKQGFKGPFEGLMPNHECVKLLAKELKEDPSTILETCRRDPRTIASNLTRYGRGRKPKRTEVAEMTTLPEKYLIDHYQKLHKVLEQCYDQLRTPELSELSLFTLEDRVAISHSYVSEMRVPAIIYEKGAIKLDIEASDLFLWECLREHLVTEFPKFDENLSSWKTAVATIVKGCHNLTKTIADRFTEIGAKMRWDFVKPGLSPDSKGYGPGVYYDKLVSLTYECGMVNHVPHFRRGYDSRELVMEYPGGEPAIARGDDSLFDQVEECCLGIVSNKTVKRKVKRLNLAKTELESLQKSTKQGLRLVLERGTFKGTCSICSDLVAKSG